MSESFASTATAIRTLPAMTPGPGRASAAPTVQPAPAVPPVPAAHPVPRAPADDPEPDAAPGIGHATGGEELAARREEAQWMAAVRGGSPEAFEHVVERHKDRLVAYLARLTGCPERAQDLAQETFLRLYRSASRYREQGKLHGLLYSIATNLVRSEERRRRRWRLLAPLLAAPGTVHPAPAPPPEAGARALQRELGRELTAALAELPLAYRVPLVLFEIEDWPHADIARHLGCRPGTVKSRLHRARRLLRRRLAPYWTPESEATS